MEGVDGGEHVHAPRGSDVYARLDLVRPGGRAPARGGGPARTREGRQVKGSRRCKHHGPAVLANAQVRGPHQAGASPRAPARENLAADGCGCRNAEEVGSCRRLKDIMPSCPRRCSTTSPTANCPRAMTAAAARDWSRPSVSNTPRRQTPSPSCADCGPPTPTKSEPLRPRARNPGSSKRSGHRTKPTNGKNPGRKTLKRRHQGSWGAVSESGRLRQGAGGPPATAAGKC